MAGYASAAFISAMRESSRNLGVFFRMDLTTPVRLSFTINDIPMEMPGYTEPGAIYMGAGRLLSIPDLEVLINSMADSVTFSLKGLDPKWTDLLLDGSEDVLGAAVTVGVAPMDERWQPITDILRLWSGTADFIGDAMPPESDRRKARKKTISLAAMAGDQSRQHQDLTTYTDAVQQTLSPGDKFCERVGRVVYPITWPRY